MNRKTTIFCMIAIWTAILEILLAQGICSAKPFYEGKTIKLIVATRPGGGYDSYGRLLASTMERYMPGVTIVVKNIPGAGHIIGTNKLYVSKPDGLTFGIFNKGLITAQLVEMKGIKFDLTKMSWLGTPATEPRVWMIATNSPFRSIKDIQNSKEMCILSSAGIGSGAHTDALLITKILGLTNIKVVPGFQGTEGEMAMMRGEVHGQIGSTDSILRMTQTGDAVPILMIANKRLPEYPDVPTLYEVAPKAQKPLVDLMVTQALISRPFAGPPGIPADRLKILRAAFEKSWKDPKLVADAKKMGRPIEFVGGEEVEAIIKSALDQPKEVVDFLKEIIIMEE
jgi:tripartite-type tricarboxylate transporter receptor subunit TctC